MYYQCGCIIIFESKISVQTCIKNKWHQLFQSDHTVGEQVLVSMCKR